MNQSSSTYIYSQLLKCFGKSKRLSIYQYVLVQQRSYQILYNKFVIILVYWLHTQKMCFLLSFYIGFGYFISSSWETVKCIFDNILKVSTGSHFMNGKIGSYRTLTIRTRIVGFNENSKLLLKLQFIII